MKLEETNMNDTAQIKTQLKTLKLSGVLDNLDLRVMEAQHSSLAYTEFLTALLLDEIETRNMNRVNRLIRNAHIGSDKTLENFDFSFNHSVNAASIRELGTCRFINKGENIFFLGPTGTGKTHLTKAICHQACRKYLSVGFYKSYEFFKELAQAELNGKINKLIKKLLNLDLLAIDDFAFKKITQQDAEFLYSIVDARYQMKSIIITSNRAISDWGAVFPDPIMANAIMDRLAHNAHQIIIKGESYRKKITLKKHKNA
jgi:DNA replication protein DnaC